MLLKYGGIFIDFVEIGENAICLIDLRGMDAPAGMQCSLPFVCVSRSSKST